MELRQLQSLVKLVDCDYSVSRAAEALFLVQSAVSQHLKKLEEELGTELFLRRGKRLTGMTPVGELVVERARATLAAVHGIEAIAEEFRSRDEGMLRIGCTHTQARYVLPGVIRSFNGQFPRVEVQIHQGTPRQLVQWATNDDVDFSICTEALAEAGRLTSIPCYRWNRSLIALPGHPLLTRESLTLDDLCEYPLVTYVYGFTGRRHFSETFARAGLEPHVVLSAADSDIIKTYVRERMGVGIIASMALDDDDEPLISRDLGDLFPWEVSRIAHLNDKYLRHFERRFIELFLAHVAAGDGRRLQPAANATD